MQVIDAKGSSLSDEQLMRLIQSGNRQALEQLYRRYGLMVRSGIARFAPGITDADIDELCQEVFFAVHKSATKYTEQQRFKGWLYGITVKKTRQWSRNQWLRRRLRDQFATEHTAAALPIEAGHDERYEMRSAIDEALSQLSNTLREPFVLQVSEGFTAMEISDCLGMNERTVYTRVFRARQQLARILKQRLGYVPGEVSDETVS